MTIRLTIEDLTRRVEALLARHGVEPIACAALATTIVSAERDGTYSHGLARLRGYLDSLASGWVDGRAAMVVDDAASAVVRVDARNGFAQAALARAADTAASKAGRQGICLLTIHNSHHFGCLWPDVEPFAAQGLVCLAFVNTRSRLVAPGARRPVLGTNPMAFACPRPGMLPLVWDQASSVMAHGDILLAAKRGHVLPEGVGVDCNGQPTRDPARVLDGGALLPFGAQKGFMVALMVETMAAALTASRFGYEDGSAAFPGAQTSNAGQSLILVHPSPAAGSSFSDRLEELLDAITAAGTQRLPGDRRYAQREVAVREGIAVSKETLDLLG